MKTLTNLIVLTVLAVGSAQANLVITLDDPDQAGIAGQTLQFFGTIVNTDTDTDPANAIYLNNDSFTFALSGASYTLTDDFFNTPLSLIGGETSGDIELFDISLANPISDPPAIYGGTYGLIGGMDGGAGTSQDNLAQADFLVDTGISTAVPEPGSGRLIGTIICLVLILRAYPAFARAGGPRRFRFQADASRNRTLS